MKLETFILNAVFLRCVISWNHCQFSHCFMLPFVSKGEVCILRLKIWWGDESFCHTVCCWMFFMEIPVRPYFVLHKVENCTRTSLHLKSNISIIDLFDKTCRDIFHIRTDCDNSCISSQKILLMTLIPHVFLIKVLACWKMSFITSGMLILWEIDQVFVFFWIKTYCL